MSRNRRCSTWCIHSSSSLDLLDEGDVVTLEQDLTCWRVSGGSTIACALLTQVPLALRLVLLGQRDFGGVVDDQVHELVETLPGGQHLWLNTTLLPVLGAAPQCAS